MLEPHVRSISPNIPFYTQRVTSFSEQGFLSQEDAEYWQSRGCGIACLKMVLDGLRGDCWQQPTPAYGVLLRECLEAGGFCEKGWIHSKLIAVAARYGVAGKSLRKRTVSDLRKELDRNRPCIVSVTVKFAGGQLDRNNQVRVRGGHLAVAIGYELTDNQVTGILVNHPSANEKYDWERRLIPLSDFEASFAGNFMSFSNRPASIIARILSTLR
jgi:Peptidase_C39 like family